MQSKLKKANSILVFGSQTWALKNLKKSCFNNGDSIPFISDSEEWKNAGIQKKPAFCFYDGKIENGNVYGYLYNYYAISDPRGLAPKGWIVPSKNDWEILINRLGGIEIAGAKFKSNKLWAAPRTPKSNHNFESSPGGFRDGNGNFGNIKIGCPYWTSTELVSNKVWSVHIVHDLPNVLITTNGEVGGGGYIRCIKLNGHK
tara:strand:+ start:1333 stop:1935 length:603 start_codon:yes stop_codon:yes gene_type:complete